ncbi:hypothetical protein CRN46_22085 [Vibrio vulnificus]|nr:putative membrane protein [Vibrio vulnificus]POC18076.1 hypothetical protein CRN46_22085 [Vibrio vulnificus]
MKQAVLSAFRGLDKSYLVKQYFIGILVCVIYAFIVRKYGQGLGLYSLVAFSVNTLLYPYSRFLFESLVKFIFGNTRFDKGSGMLVMLKLLSIVFCWSSALFVAPFGLLYIHFRGVRGL